jgi:subtilisin family serine protease
MTRVTAFACALAAALTLVASAAAFTPTDPLTPQQWYLTQDHAFDAWVEPPPLTIFTPIKVAIVDSGIDYGHPEFAGKIAGGRSFVSGDWRVDKNGHGTFVAGTIAANLDQQGIVGLAYPAARLLIAKVVRPDGQIPVTAEAAAIRWAADEGARVINLSFGAPRDPRSQEIDAYSQVEADAVAYAYQKGAVLVAAVGNGDEAPKTPWPWASYPAALPHVIGVSALTRGGSVPAFSNRDRLYNDISAPGQDIFSTFPRSLASAACVQPGYSDCASDEYRHARGTSFAAPQVAAAAALVIALDPTLRPDQVSWLLERSADDANASNGCTVCPLQRDSFSGWGRLDVARAVGSLVGPLPPPDLYESNDEAGNHAHTIDGKRGHITATLDYWDDQVDVYRLRVLKGERLSVRLIGSPGSNIDLILWEPGTKRVDDLESQHLRLTQSARPGSHEQIAYRAAKTGWYFIEAKTTNTGTAVYAIDYTRT